MKGKLVSYYPNSYNLSLSNQPFEIGEIGKEIVNLIQTNFQRDISNYYGKGLDSVEIVDPQGQESFNITGTNTIISWEIFPVIDKVAPQMFVASPPSETLNKLTSMRDNFYFFSDLTVFPAENTGTGVIIGIPIVIEKKDLTMDDMRRNVINLFGYNIFKSIEPVMKKGSFGIDKVYSIKLTLDLRSFLPSSPNFDVAISTFYHGEEYLAPGLLDNVMEIWLPLFADDLKGITPPISGTLPNEILLQDDPIRQVRRSRDYCVNSLIGQKYCQDRTTGQIKDVCNNILVDKCITQPLNQTDLTNIKGSKKGEALQERGLHIESNSCNFLYNNTNMGDKYRNFQQNYIVPNAQYFFDQYYNVIYPKEQRNLELTDDEKYIKSQIFQGGNASCFQDSDQVNKYWNIVFDEEGDIIGKVLGANAECYPSCGTYYTNNKESLTGDRIIHVQECKSNICAAKQDINTGDISTEKGKVEVGKQILNCFGAGYNCNDENECVVEEDGKFVTKQKCEEKCGGVKPKPPKKTESSTNSRVILFSTIGVILIVAIVIVNIVVLSKKKRRR